MSDYKVGNELVFDVDGRLCIEQITHITKAGRMKVGTFSFSVLPDLSLYGEKKEKWGPFYKCLGKPTDLHRKKVVRQSKVADVLVLLRTFTINGISESNLDALLKVLTEHSQSVKK
jgi:hypothetical protein